MSRAVFSLLFIGALLIAAWPLRAQSSSEITYTVKQGDTLYRLAQRYFVDPRAILAIQKANRIRNPRRIPVGEQLRIPRKFLKFEQTPLRVRSFSGPVRVHFGGTENAPAIGATISEGSLIRTGARGFISLVGTGNSRVSLPSNSRARLVSARRYLIDNALDVDLRILDGRGEVIAPKLKKNERFRVGTPLAVTAVRGTRFRVVHDEGSNAGGTEVLEGMVEVATDADTITAPEGFGVTMDADGLGDVAALLPAPDVIEPGKIQTDKTVTFAIVPLDGARGYRTQLARDAGFVEVVAETVDANPQVVFDQLKDGRFYVRARGISQRGLEGYSDVYSFRRKQVGVSGGVESSPLDDAFRFAWLPEGDGVSYQGFQLWKAGEQDRLLVDEVGLTSKGLLLSDLEPGEYYWRVASFQIDEGDVIKVWGLAQKMIVSPQ